MLEPIALGVVAIVAVVLILAAFETIRIADWERGALYVNEGLDRVLQPGRHRVFRLGRRLYVNRISLAPAYQSIGPVDALTADRLPVRLNATVIYRVTDAEISLKTPPYPQIQLSASQAMLTFAASHPLEVLLARSGTGDAEALSESTGDLSGVEIERIALSAIVLPPELRRMSTEVERAKQEGVAALERARGEHAALRALANAARMLKDNPELMNLRLVQALGAGGKGATLVLGDGAIRPSGHS